MPIAHMHVFQTVPVSKVVYFKSCPDYVAMSDDFLKYSCTLVRKKYTFLHDSVCLVLDNLTHFSFFMD